MEAPEPETGRRSGRRKYSSTSAFPAQTTSHPALSLPSLLKAQALSEFVDDALSLIEEMGEISTHLASSCFAKYVLAAKLKATMTEDEKSSAVALYRADSEKPSPDLATEVRMFRRDIRDFLTNTERKVQESGDNLEEATISEATVELKKFTKRGEEFGHIWQGYLLAFTYDIDALLIQLTTRTQDDVMSVLDGTTPQVRRRIIDNDDPSLTQATNWLTNPINSLKDQLLLYNREFAGVSTSEDSTRRRKQFQIMQNYTEILKFAILPQLESSDSLESLNLSTRVRYALLLFDLIKEKIGESYDSSVNHTSYESRLSKSLKLTEDSGTLISAQNRAQTSTEIFSQNFTDMQSAVDAFNIVMASPFTASGSYKPAMPNDALAHLVATEIVHVLFPPESMLNLLPIPAVGKQYKNLPATLLILQDQIIEEAAKLIAEDSSLDDLRDVLPEFTKKYFSEALEVEECSTSESVSTEKSTEPHRFSNLTKKTALGSVAIAIGFAIARLLVPQAQEQAPEPVKAAGIRSLSENELGALSEPKVIGAIQIQQAVQKALKEARELEEAERFGIVAPYAEPSTTQQ